SLSAHADQKELIDWMDSIKNIPERVFLIHGEQEALLEFKIKIADVYKWHVYIPEIFETVELIF
ncbi:MAG: MBL fold metallo-hydrolase RNA specificity domain-containing protein, partial [Eudoraea sp.]